MGEIQDYDDELAAIRKVHARGSLSGSAMTAKHRDHEAGRELTSRELDVLLMLRDGLSQEQIGRRLAIASRTVRVHILALKEKLGASSTVQCMAKAYDLGILRPGAAAPSRSASRGSSARDR